MGIGEAAARKFSDEGVNCVLVARRRELLDKLAAQMDPGRVAVYAMDIADYAAFDRLLTEVKVRWGTIDYLINNAGAHTRGPVFTIAPENFPQMTGLFFIPEQLGRILRVNGIAGIKVSCFCLREMRQLLEQVSAEKFSLFADVGFLLRHTIEMGGRGVIDPVASFAPHLVVETYEACGKGDAQCSQVLQEKILDYDTDLEFVFSPGLCPEAGLQNDVARLAAGPQLKHRRPARRHQGGNKTARPPDYCACPHAPTPAHG